MILGAFLFGVNNIAIKSCLQRGMSVSVIIMGRYLVTFFAALAMVWWTGWMISREIGKYALMSAVFLCIRLFGLNKVIEHSSPSYMTMMSMVNPVLMIAGAWLIFGESMSGIQIL